MSNTSLIRPFVLDGFLTPYQEQGWKLSANVPGFMLWWACGSGKTLAALLWAASGPPNQKVIIVTRAPTKRQWQREAQNYTLYRPEVLTGKTPYEPTSDIVILSWATLQGWGDYLLRWARGGPLAVVWDEIHKGKGWKRKGTRRQRR